MLTYAELQLVREHMLLKGSSRYLTLPSGQRIDTNEYKLVMNDKKHYGLAKFYPKINKYKHCLTSDGCPSDPNKSKKIVTMESITYCSTTNTKNKKATKTHIANTFEFVVSHFFTNTKWKEIVSTKSPAIVQTKLDDLKDGQKQVLDVAVETRDSINGLRNIIEDRLPPPPSNHSVLPSCLSKQTPWNSVTSKTTKNKKVSFNIVTERHYPMTLGGIIYFDGNVKPAAPGVALGWDHSKELAFTVDDHYKKRRIREPFRIQDTDRWDMLAVDFTKEELKAAIPVLPVDIGDNEVETLVDKARNHANYVALCMSDVPYHDDQDETARIRRWYVGRLKKNCMTWDGKAFTFTFNDALAKKARKAYVDAMNKHVVGV